MADVAGIRRPARGSSAWLRRPLVAGLLLLVAYAGLSLLFEHHGFLGTDTGGKVATLAVMSRDGSWVPDVGYWAEGADPSGRLHPLYFTYRVGDHWVNVSTLPMLLAAAPLHRIGGYQLALLWPMLGGVAAAFGARAIARRVGAGDGWAAFWVVGLASPVTIYALDLWEHTLGAAALVWAVVVLLDAVGETDRWWRGLAAGLLFGAAFTMRTEAAVYALASTAIAVVLLGRARRWRSALLLGGGAAAGFVALVAGNQLLELAVLGGSSRAGRATGAAGAGLSDPALRAREALTTTLSLPPGADASAWAMGALAVALVGFAAWRAGRPGGRRPALVALGVAGLVYVLRFSDGLGFVPGLLVTAPFAVVALVRGWISRPARVALAMVLVPVPMVWAFQFTGGAIPQWGGRYLLTTAVVATAVGVAAATVTAAWLRNGVAILAVAVTAFGVLFGSWRTHEVARAASTLRDRPETAVVSGVGFWLRELGDASVDRPWLSATTDEDRRQAARIVAEAGVDRLAYVDLAEEPTPNLPGWRSEGETVETWLGVPFRITTYRHVE